MGDGEGRAGPAHPGPSRKFYGRLRGKALRPSRRRLMEELLPRLAVPGVRRGGASVPGAGSDRGAGFGEGSRPDAAEGSDGGLGDVSGLGEGPASPPGDASGTGAGSGEVSGDGAGLASGETVDLAALFGDARPVWLEIGFGGGEHLVHQAALHPEVGLIGAEPFVNGVAMALARIEAEGLGNVRIHAADARDLLDQLPAGGIARVFLLYPDPWPKTRHWDRRFMNPDNLAALARVMAPGAELRLATDIEDYARHAIRAAEIAGGFALQGEPPDWARPWADWVTTRFEARARREGRGSQYLTFVRR